MELDITIDWLQYQHTLTIEEVCKKLATSIDNGLTQEAADVRLSKFGFNELS